MQMTCFRYTPLFPVDFAKERNTDCIATILRIVAGEAGG